MDQPSGSKRIRVLVAEGSRLGSELVSGALKRCGNSFNVDAVAGDSAETLRAIYKHEPDVAIISAGLSDGPTTGLLVLQGMRVAKSKTASVLIIDSEDEDFVLRAFRAGARGIFCRHTPLKKLAKCIRRIHDGQIWASTDQLNLILQFVANLEPKPTPKLRSLTTLTQREREVACLVAEGLSNKEIAEKLKLREHTIRNYIFHVFDKLGLSSRVELVLYALSQPEGDRL